MATTYSTSKPKESLPTSRNKIPKNFNSSDFFNDVLAGFVVFLIALPLSLGIAMASGFPPISGLFTAAIGGIVVGLLAGSPLTIKGPAAGMIVIMLGAVEELGRGNPALGVKLTLSAVAICGVIQIVLGLVKIGKISSLFPVSSVHGMLTAIGIIIISKQIHTLMGVSPISKEPLHLLAEIPHSLLNANLATTIIGLVAILIMLLWPKFTYFSKLSFLTKIPPPLIAVLSGVGLSLIFNFKEGHILYIFGLPQEISTKFLVNIPKDTFSAVIFPDFSQLMSGTWVKWLFMIVAVGTLESMLTVKAIDAMKADRSPSDMNRDIIAVGCGNFLAGMIGGLPMIAEVVRSSANLNAHAKSRFANVFHGLFIALFAFLMPELLGFIPTAALSGLLIYTGCKLASYKHWSHALKLGPEQFLVFVVTVIVTISTDLLIGIAVGIFLEFVLNLILSGSITSIFRPSYRLVQASIQSEQNTRLEIHSPLVFSNLYPIISKLNHLSKYAKKKIILDFSKCTFIDCTSYTLLYSMSLDRHQNTQNIELIHIDLMRNLSSHPLSAKISQSNKIIDLIGIFQPSSTNTQLEISNQGKE